MLQDSRQPPVQRPQDLLGILRRTAVFGRLTEEQLQALARRTHLMHLDAGEILFQRGEKARALYLVVGGQLKLYRTSADGNEVIVDLLEAGMTFAESRAFFDDPHHHVNCAVLADAEVAAVDLAAFRAALRESVDTCLLLLHRLSERAERRIDDIDRLALQSGACRVASYLLGQLPSGRSDYRLNVPKSVLASRLGIRAETLSRALKHLSTAGLVSVTGQNIVRVPSRQRLQRFVEETGKS